MAICQQTFSKFTASDPQLTITSRSNPRFYDRVGQDHHGREPDVSFIQLEPAFVACRATDSILDTVAARRQTEDAFYTVVVANDERRG